MIRQTAFACALTCAATQASAGMVWGVNGHPLTAYPGIPIADQLDLVRDLGMTSYRVNISFADQADHLGTIIDAAKAQGIDILPVLTPGDLDFQTDAEDEIYRKTFAFAQELGTRFADDVRVWELGNEEENHAILQPCEMREDGTQYPCEWGPAGGVDPLDYHGERWNQVSELLRGLSDGLEAATPDALKAMGTAGWGHVGAFERMRRDGIDWDISVWHIYGEDPEWAFEILESFRRPIWVTELNHPYGSRDGGEAQAEGLVAMMSRLRELSDAYRVEAVYAYELLDESYWAPDFEAVMGLASLAKTPDGWMVGPRKPAYAAVRTLIRQAAPTRCSDLDAMADVPSPARQAAYGHCLLFGEITEPEQVEDWAASLASGEASPSDMLATIVNGPDFVLQNQAAAADSRSYITLLYGRLLGREPDGYGLNSYAEQISAGALSREELARILVSSEEFLGRHPVFRERDPSQDSATPSPACALDALPTASSHGEHVVAYASCLLLSRELQESGLLQWTSAIESGAATPPELLSAVFRSAVFDARHRTADLSNSEYVTFVYHLLLSREPDGGGFRSYVEQLNAGALGRQELGLALMQSSEFAARHPLLFGTAVEKKEAVQSACDPASAALLGSDSERYVAYTHCLVLGVGPEQEVLRQWSEALDTGQASRNDFVVGLLRSDAFAVRREPETLSDSAFVTLIFRMILGRDPDGAGLEAYVGQLAQGSITRENVVLGALGSSEFAARYAALTE